MKRTSEAAGLDDATRAAYESALAEAQLNLRGNSALKLPWERGGYAQIFSDAELPPMPDISIRCQSSPDRLTPRVQACQRLLSKSCVLTPLFSKPALRGRIQMPIVGQKRTERQS